MLEAELFALLETTADAAYTVTRQGEIRSWNAAAQRLLGYSAAEALGRDVDELLDAHDSLGTDALSGGADAASRSREHVPAFDLEVHARDGRPLWINVSTLVFDNPRTHQRLFIRLARGIGERKRKEAVLDQMLQAARQVIALGDAAAAPSPVDSLSDQERRILTLFARGNNAATIARTLDISAQTLRNHLHRINRKLRTHSRLEAVTHAQQRGLID